MVEAQCFTSLATHTYGEWPTVFAALQRVGDFVQAECGKSLKINKIVHTVRNRTKGELQGDKMPYIIVFLREKEEE